MKFYEFGDKSNRRIMLIHGGGNSKWMFERPAALLAKDYYVIVPELDGHGEEKDIVYETTEKEADKIVEYIISFCDSHLFAITGASLGAQIALEVLSRTEVRVEYAVIESGLCSPKPFMAYCMKARWMIKMMCAMYDYPGMVEWSCKYYGWPVEYAKQLARDAKAVSMDSYRNLYQSYLNYSLPERISNCSTRALFLYGNKEKGMMKKDVKLAASYLDNSELKILQRMNHCGISIGDPVRYSKLIEDFLNEN